MSIKTKDIEVILENYNKKLNIKDVIKNQTTDEFVIKEGFQYGFENYDLEGNFNIDKEAYKKYMVDICLNKK